MNIKVRKIGNGFGVILPKQMLESLALQEGSMLEVETTGNVIQMTLRMSSSQGRSKHF